MKIHLLAIALIGSLQVVGQEKLLFDTALITSTTKLIGRYEHFDKRKTFKELNFCIENPVEIKNCLVELTIGKEVANAFEDPCFVIALVQNHEEIERWTINPTLKSAMYNGYSYEFDIRKLKKFSARHPFDYTVEKIVFNSKPEYMAYLQKQLQDKRFLFNYDPAFRYEGTFQIEFPRNSTYSSPKAIIEYLSLMIEKWMNKEDYNLYYRLDVKNMKDQNQFTMSIDGNKNLFERLELPDLLKKENWKPTIETAYFFYKTH